MTSVRHYNKFDWNYANNKPIPLQPVTWNFSIWVH
jgi:hypothetical protein